MGWISEKLGRIAQLPKPLLFTHIFAKLVFGCGLGLVLASMVRFDWALAGWVLIVLAVLISIPSVYLILKKQ
ncbi:MAG: hypothetical protein ABII00_18715 [Elusimicrobiota bacterium]